MEGEQFGLPITLLTTAAGVTCLLAMRSLGASM